MAFAVMRFAKLKTGAPISGSISHVTRARVTENADADRRHLNVALVGENRADFIRSAIEERTPERYRKDAVRALEFVISASPEFFEGADEQKTEQFFDQSVAWLKAHFGDENVVSAVVHHDESTPHMHAYIIPLDPDSGRLNSKRWIGGRGKLRSMQTDFANHVADLGLERGVSKAETGRDHTTIQQWQAGHSQLDEREKALDAEHSRRSERIHAAESEIVQRHYAQESQQAAIAERERALTEKAHRLDALEKELAKRGERLSGGESALLQRQQEIEKAGAVLQQRLNAARAQQQQWEQQKRAWVSENKPQVLEINETVQHLQTLEKMDNRREMLEFIVTIDDENHENGSKAPELCQLYDGANMRLTEEGRRYLEKHGVSDEKRQELEKWKSHFPSSGPSGPQF